MFCTSCIYGMIWLAVFCWCRSMCMLMSLMLEGEEGGATEVPQRDIAESADQQKTPKKSQTPAK